jgi:SH3 domain-containing YSC84-like protein 1
MKFAVLSLILVLPAFADRRDDDIKRIDASESTLREIMHAKDGGVPDDLMRRARCVGVIPAAKRAGFIVGGQYGKGIVTCRLHDSNRWSGPSMVILEGGSFGLQIGAGETDIVFTVMNESGENKLSKDKVTLGADVTAAIGPLGRSVQAQTDAAMHAEILTWSRARGVFGGVDVNGASLRPDNDDNEALYGHHVSQIEVLHGAVPSPKEAHALHVELDRYAPVKKPGTGE